jgi:hypothetical protein
MQGETVLSSTSYQQPWLKTNETPWNRKLRGTGNFEGQETSWDRKPRAQTREDKAPREYRCQRNLAANAKMPGAKWTCCECGRTSYHLDGVQCEECVSYAHARCEGFRLTRPPKNPQPSSAAGVASRAICQLPPFSLYQEFPVSHPVPPSWPQRTQVPTPPPPTQGPLPRQPRRWQVPQFVSQLSSRSFKGSLMSSQKAVGPTSHLPHLQCHPHLLP